MYTALIYSKQIQVYIKNTLDVFQVQLLLQLDRLLSTLQSLINPEGFFS